MVIDSSAIVAGLLQEPEAGKLANALQPYGSTRRNNLNEYVVTRVYPGRGRRDDEHSADRQVAHGRSHPCAN